jgi:hypothetical protein
MANCAFVYRCPATGHRVQGFVGASVPDDTSTYEGVMCTVCNRAHLVNPSNGRTDLHRTLNTVLKKPRRPAWVSPGLPLCPGRQTDPAQHKRTGEFVSERLPELVSERLRSARAPNCPGIADEMREEHRRRVLSRMIGGLRRREAARRHALMARRRLKLDYVHE